jgi:hypothetical protein
MRADDGLSTSASRPAHGSYLVRRKTGFIPYVLRRDRLGDPIRGRAFFKPGLVALILMIRSFRRRFSSFEPPPIHMPLRLEAAILSRMRSPVTSAFEVREREQDITTASAPQARRTTLSAMTWYVDTTAPIFLARATFTLNGSLSVRRPTRRDTASFALIAHHREEPLPKAP